MISQLAPRLDLSQDKNGKFSLFRFLEIRLFLGSIKKLWEHYNASLSFTKNLCRYVWTYNGDKVRLADTELFIEVEKDLTKYGDEVKFGGVKLHDEMGQSQVSREDGAVDTVITNVLIVDITGIYKADIGLKDGLIHAIESRKS